MSFALICQHNPEAACDEDDSELRHRVISFLRTWTTAEGSVTVEVVRGVVRIRGKVASHHDRWLLCGCCSHVEGVRRVEDELIIVPGLDASKEEPGHSADSSQATLTEKKASRGPQPIPKKIRQNTPLVMG